MNKKLLVAFLGCFLVTFAATVKADRINGTCPEFDPIEDYKPKKDSRQWFMISAADKGLAYEDRPCYTMFRQTLPNNDLKIETQYKTKGDIKRSFIHAVKSTPIGKFEFSETYASREYRKRPTPMALKADKIIMTVLDSDYKNYMVWVVCRQNNDTTYVYEANIFSRERHTISDDSLKSAKAALNKAGITETLNYITLC